MKRAAIVGVKPLTGPELWCCRPDQSQILAPDSPCASLNARSVKLVCCNGKTTVSRKRAAAVEPAQLVVMSHGDEPMHQTQLPAANLTTDDEERKTTTKKTEEKLKGVPEHY